MNYNLPRGFGKRTLVFAAVAIVAINFAILALFQPRAWSTHLNPSDLDEIRQELIETGVSEVSVMFKVTPGGDDFNASAASVSNARATFLDDLETEPTVLHRYVTTPAVAVRLTSQAQLDELLNNPVTLSVSKPIGPGGVTSTSRAAPPYDGQAKLDVAVPIVGADEQHSLGYMGQTMRVAVLDSGIDTDHPDLHSSLVNERCYLKFVDSTPCPNGSSAASGPGSAEDDNGHGTAVIGVITSDGIVTPLGVSPHAKIEAFKVLDSAGNGDFRDVLIALEFIRNNRPEVDVINLSMGTTNVSWPGVCDGVYPAFEMVVDQLRAQGRWIIAATGNDGLPNQTDFPACLSSVISVAATRHGSRRLADFSNVSSSTDVSAPGETIRTSALGGGVTVAGGTSFAAPVASACATLFLQNGTTPTALRSRIRHATLDTLGTTFVVPWLNCSPLCNGKLVSVSIGLGDNPTDGHDVIMGTTGPDNINGLDGNDTICGLGGADRIRGGPGRDTVLAGDGPDYVHGGGGDDTLLGEQGNDQILGAAGLDRINGGKNSDILYGNGSADLISGGTGNDEIAGGNGADNMSGGDGNDTIRGLVGPDILIGGAGDDKMFGGKGNDVLSGGSGLDRCSGNAGGGDSADASCEQQTGIA